MRIWCSCKVAWINSIQPILDFGWFTSLLLLFLILSFNAVSTSRSWSACTNHPKTCFHILNCSKCSISLLPSFNPSRLPSSYLLPFSLTQPCRPLAVSVLLCIFYASLPSIAFLINIDLAVIVGQRGPCISITSNYMHHTHTHMSFDKSNCKFHS